MKIFSRCSSQISRGKRSFKGCPWIHTEDECMLMVSDVRGRWVRKEDWAVVHWVLSYSR